MWPVIMFNWRLHRRPNTMLTRKIFIPDDPVEWLHRNDNYVPLRVSSHRTVATPHTEGIGLGVSLLLHSTRVINIKFSYFIYTQ